MKQITREKFDGTFFDVSQWTDEQKTKFQERCFELDYQWLGYKADIQDLQAQRYYLRGVYLTYANSQYKSAHHEVQKQYTDMFPEEIPQPKEKSVSIFDNPVWVTCSSDDLSGLTFNKDYEVLHMDRGGYQVYDDHGSIVFTHKSHFYKVLPEDLLPAKDISESEEDERGFDELVYVEPTTPWDYLILSKLTEDQKAFIYQELVCDENPVTTEYPRISFEENAWYTGYGIEEGNEISFNQLFKYKEDM
jgi:hypothetical protein